MSKTFWLLLALGGVLAFTSSRSGPATCTSCSLSPAAWMPDLTRLIFPQTMALPYPAPPPPETWRPMTADQRLADARARLLPKLPAELDAQGLSLGRPAYIRIFKETRELELWLQGEGEREWTLFRTYPVAAMSGRLGPKLMEGDGQAPEGFYEVNAAAMNPASSFHLSFNVGYPNAYDRHHGRTGTFIMVHGAELSIGCFAMTDPVIEEIYLIVEAALAGGQAQVPVHAFPFRMTEARLARVPEEETELVTFWQQLRPAYDHFEKTRTVPPMVVQDGQYRLLK